MTLFLCGLLPVYPGRSQRDDYPLLQAKVHYDLSDVQMLANLTQTYTSNASVDAEIRYVFPLPPDASVCAFKAVIDGERTIKGIVKEKVKAKAEYNQAVAQGKTAALLEQQNVEIFQVSLGNIRPKQTIEVHISFVSVISHDGSLDSLRLTFPTAIAPRYGTPPTGVLDMFRRSRSNYSKALELSVSVEMTSHIKSITSPSHPIAMKFGESTVEPSQEFDPTKARVSLSSSTLLEKDIVLVLSCQGLDRPRCMVESFSPEEGGQEYTDAYALTLVPRFELPPIATQEYIFLVDRSGSMGGGKMDAVRSALQILLMSLPSRGTFFNIISFGSGHSSLWPSSLPYSADSVKTASSHVDSMTANYGGTEIREAIEAAFASRVARPNSDVASTSVFVLTDGQAYDLDGVQSAIRAAVANATTESLLLRVFCMGIGNAVSKAMCDIIARAGQGTAAFVGEDEKPDQKLMGLLRAARGAIVEDISIDWGVGEDTLETDIQDFEMVSGQDGSPKPPTDVAPISLFDESNTISSETPELGPQTFPVKLPPPPRVQQAPATNTLPPLYPGFRTSLFAIVRRGAGGNTAPSKTVRIKGTALGRPVVLEVPVSHTSKSTAETRIKMVHSLAARALIQSIEDKAAQFMSEVDKAEVLRLAERYGLASSQTSFVAVYEQDERASSSRTSMQQSSTTLSELTTQLPPYSPAHVDNSPRGFSDHIRSVLGWPARSKFSSTSHASSPQSFYAVRDQERFSPNVSTSSLSQPPAPGNMVAQPTGGPFGAFGGGAPSQLAGGPFEAFGDKAPSPQREGFGSFGASSPPPPLSPPGAWNGPAPAAPAMQAPRQLFKSASRSAASGDPQKVGGEVDYSPNIYTRSRSLDNLKTSHEKSSRHSRVPMPQQQQQLSRQGSPQIDMLESVEAFDELSDEQSLREVSYEQSLREVSYQLSYSSHSPRQHAPPTIETFARAQSFDGSFSGSLGLFRQLFEQPQAPTIPPAFGTVDTIKETIWCTLLCVAYLEIKFADDKDVWTILVEKAMQFVEDCLKEVVGADDVAQVTQELMQEARKCIA